MVNEIIDNEIMVLPMALTDLDELMKIELLSFTAPWSKAAYLEELLFNKVAMYFVAKSPTRLLGYAGIWLVLDEGHITNIAVHPDFRRHGVAAKLLNKLEEYAGKNKVKKLFLEVRKSNLAARNLYSKHAFKEDGVRKKYYLDNGEDAILMSRNIQIDAE